MSINEEEYGELIELYLKHIKTYMTESGGLFPHITIFADQIDKEETEEKIPKAIIHVPIPSEYMNSDDDKNVFVDEILPSIFKTVKEKFIPYGIAWASEAWMRVADKDFNPKKQNYKDLPINKEILFISIESDFKNETFIYDIKRVGHQVCADGDLVDTIQLIEIPEMKDVERTEGRFSGLYKKLIKQDV